MVIDWKEKDFFFSTKKCHFWVNRNNVLFSQKKRKSYIWQDLWWASFNTLCAGVFQAKCPLIIKKAKCSVSPRYLQWDGHETIASSQCICKNLPYILYVIVFENATDTNCQWLTADSDSDNDIGSRLNPEYINMMYLIKLVHFPV